MANQITDEDFELLGELGVDTAPDPIEQLSAKQQRIIAGFEEIERFVEQHGRLPQHGEQRDIFERLYAVRLDRLRESEECRSVLLTLDSRGLLGMGASSHMSPSEDLSDEALLASLGVETDAEDDITQLKHVRSRNEIKTAEEIAQRNPCKDFDQFKPIFDAVQRELATGERQTVKYQDNAEVRQGDLFILEGQKAIVANMGALFRSDYGRQDRRLRVVYDNATESDLLLRSLQRALNRDKASRRITAPDLGPIFTSLSSTEDQNAMPIVSDIDEANDLPSGTIYVLRSKSDHPFVAENRLVIHKIGVTGGEVKDRIANAKKDPTYLLAEVEIVATFKLVNINRKKLEELLQKFFGSARLDLEFLDRFGVPVKPREWFLVPLQVIEQVIEKIKDGTIAKFRYDLNTASLVRL
ncbi:MAG: GIY-YIG nuclease family protein [Anaerolineae bacterium]|nr:GIY-YIG nuclease family protein [Anaerolineae bacterium]